MTSSTHLIGTLPRADLRHSRFRCAAASQELQFGQHCRKDLDVIVAKQDRPVVHYMRMVIGKLSLL
jgi:hypothetical protein